MSETKQLTRNLLAKVIASRKPQQKDFDLADKLLRLFDFPEPRLIAYIVYPCGCTSSYGSPDYCPEHGKSGKSA